MLTRDPSTSRLTIGISADFCRGRLTGSSIRYWKVSPRLTPAAALAAHVDPGRGGGDPAAGDIDRVRQGFLGGGGLRTTPAAARSLRGRRQCPIRQGDERADREAQGVVGGVLFRGHLREPLHVAL